MTPWRSRKAKALLLVLILGTLGLFYGLRNSDLPDADGSTEEEIFNV
jgi:hypothetical protein